jgi:hypothetical protein
MAMQDAGPVIVRQPAGDQRVGLGAGSVLEQRVRHRVQPMRAGRLQREASFGDRPAMRQVQVLGVRPAEIGQEPPVRAIVRRHPLAEVHARLRMTGHPGKGEQAEGAQRQRQDEGVARPRLHMGQHLLQRRDRIAADGTRERLDMAAFARGPVRLNRRLGLADHRARLHIVGRDQQCARPRRPGQREVGVQRQRLVERLGRARPAGQAEIDTIPIVRRRCVRRRRERQTAAIHPR